jgi:hypothetical protein
MSREFKKLWLLQTPTKGRRFIVRVIPERLLVGNPSVLCCPACNKQALVYENGCLLCAACIDGQQKIWAPDPEDQTLWGMFTAFAVKAQIFPDAFSRIRSEILSLLTDPVEMEGVAVRR